MKLKFLFNEKCRFNNFCENEFSFNIYCYFTNF
jgi:hypothetical protein